MNSSNSLNVQDVYELYTVPPNLATHMRTVAKVVCSIRDYWVGEGIDWNSIIQAALLHDIGNIVKFDFEHYPELLGDESANIDHWKAVQKDIINRYGKDDHEVCGNILREIGVSQKMITTIETKSFANSVVVAQSDEWDAKILLYADMRVKPFGIVPLEDRLDDVRDRMPQYYNRPDFEELLEAARSIEVQVATHLSRSIADIPWGQVTETDTQLNSVVIR